MTRETKIGLLVGLGVILAIGVLISDHLSVAERGNPAHQLDHHAAGPANDPSLTGSTQFAERRGPLPEPRGENRDGRDGVRLLDDRDQSPPPHDPADHGIWRLNRTQAQPPRSPETPPRPQPHRQPRPRPHPNPAPHTTQGQPSPQPEVDRLVQRMPEPQPPRQNPGDRYHHVARGETLTTIARDYYGHGAYWRTIYEANPREIIPSPNALRSGVRILIPMRRTPAGAAAREAVAPRADRAATPARTKTYAIRKGDTLTELAQQFMGTSRKWQELYQMNTDKIDDPDRLIAGVEIVVPD